VDGKKVTTGNGGAVLTRTKVVVVRFSEIRSGWLVQQLHPSARYGQTSPIRPYSSVVSPKDVGQQEAAKLWTSRTRATQPSGTVMPVPQRPG